MGRTDPTRHSTEARRYRVRGRVQGVGFRFFVERAATDLGLTGYVKNCFDGSVEVYAAGPPEKLRQLEKHLAAGPRWGRVDRVEKSEAPVEPRQAFTIEY